MLSQSQFHNLIRQFLCFGRIGSSIYFYCQLAAGWGQTPCVVLLVQVAVCLIQGIALHRIPTIGTQIPGLFLTVESVGGCCKESWEEGGGIHAFNLQVYANLCQLLLQNNCNRFHVWTVSVVDVGQGHAFQTGGFCKLFCFFQVVNIVRSFRVVQADFRGQQGVWIGCQLLGTISTCDDLIPVDGIEESFTLLVGQVCRTVWVDLEVVQSCFREGVDVVFVGLCFVFFQFVQRW